MRHIQATLVFSCLALVGCATATEIHAPDGEKAMLIECPGAAVPLSACFDKANEVCPAGYALLDAYEGGSAATVGAFGGYAATGIQKRIVIRCKPD